MRNSDEMSIEKKYPTLIDVGKYHTKKKSKNYIHNDLNLTDQF